MSTHASVLLYLAVHQDETMATIARDLEFTERTTASAIADLRADGYLDVSRRGRRNHYRVNGEKPLRRSGFTHLRVSDLLGALRVATGAARDGAKGRKAL
jgi:predicted ArsR family transcriptional regulator